MTKCRPTDSWGPSKPFNNTHYHWKLEIKRTVDISQSIVKSVDRGSESFSAVLSGSSGTTALSPVHGSGDRRSVAASQRGAAGKPTPRRVDRASCRRNRPRPGRLTTVAELDRRRETTSIVATGHLPPPPNAGAPPPSENRCDNPSHCLSHILRLRRTSVVCVLEDMVASFAYVSIVFVKKNFYSPMLISFFFVIVNLSVWFVFGVFFLFLFFQHLRLSFVVFTNKEIPLIKASAYRRYRRSRHRNSLTSLKTTCQFPVLISGC